MIKINEIEQLFFKVIADLEEYLPYLVLVGGWAPYLYAKYLWKNLNVYPVTTTDIDFGISVSNTTPKVSETIYSRLSKLHYGEKHLKMDRLFPIIPLLESTCKTARVLIEFITTPEVDRSYIEKLVGRQILVNRLDKFDILLRNNIQINLIDHKALPSRTYTVIIPQPHIFLFHKTLIFVERENEEKMAKDIYYIYYILRFHPRIDSLFQELRQLKYGAEKALAGDNLRDLFARVNSPGCLMVEQENGPDDYIDDVRRDAFERFQELVHVLDS